MAQLVKCLSWKPEDLNLILNTQIKDSIVTHAYNSSTVGLGAGGALGLSGQPVHLNW